jgi:hypothetical protein
MNGVDLKHKLKIAKPKDSTGFGIPLIEWEFIKSKIAQIKDEPNVPFILSSALLGACLSGLYYSITGNFPENSDGSGSIALSMSWAFTAFFGILSIVFFLFGRTKSQRKQAKASNIIEHMDLIEARFKSEKIIAETSPVETIESEKAGVDNLETANGWQQYLNGQVSLTEEIAPYVGSYCVKKDSNNDPHGGFKRLKKTVALGFIFAGYIYRPSEYGGGAGDRIAIEDNEFNGYGFAVAHGFNFIVIERRDGGGATEISQKISIIPPKNQWYKFELHTSIDGKLALYLDTSSGQRLGTVTAVDSTYSQFDRITIHGGYPYYLCGLKITKI